MKLSIVLPCLNEAETLEACLRKAQLGLKDANIEGEILVADNGSKDGSERIALEFGARLISVQAKGYGNALRGGIDFARGEWIVMGDSDDSYDFSRLQPFLEKLSSGYELVMGCRFPAGGGTILPGAMPWKHRWLGNPVLSFIGRLFFRCPIHDFHCGLRAFTREAYRKMDLQTTGMEFASEMVIKSILGGLRMTEVPITLHPDGRSRPPHLKSWSDGWRHLRFMLLFSPRWLFIWPGSIASLAGTALFVILEFGPMKIGKVQFDTSTLLFASTLLLVGTQTVFFGIFARLWCESMGLLSRHHVLERILRWFPLERRLLVSLALLAGGGFLLIRALLYWKSAQFGEISYPDNFRRTIPAVVALMLGFQTLFSNFFLSILDLSIESKFSGPKTAFEKTTWE